MFEVLFLPSFWGSIHLSLLDGDSLLRLTWHFFQFSQIMSIPRSGWGHKTRQKPSENLSCWVSLPSTQPTQKER